MGYIKSIAINEFEGAFNQTIHFKTGLNILSGVNGTGKTTALKRIKERLNTDQVQKEGTIAGVISFSPKRNAEKKSVLTALQFIRQQSRTSEMVLSEASNRALIDNTFEKYESFGDLYGYEFQDKCRSGGDQIEIMKALTSEYNKIVKKVFPEYEIQTEWSTTTGFPDVKLITKYGVPLDLSLMSCGESEVLALIFNVFFNKDKNDVFLIDEPEVHLNWSLEKGLFTFFDNFAQDNQKQIIVTSHSRVIFDQAFREKTQFFVFRDKKVFVEADPPKEVLEDIAGETVAIISTAAPTEKTFFVEDDFHKALIEQLLGLYDKNAEIVIVKDASGMITNLYKLLKSNHEINKKWVNAYLMRDGDGLEEEYKRESRFVHLKRFVAESYCFDIPAMAKVLGKSEDELKQAILALIKGASQDFAGHYGAFIGKLLDKATKTDIDLDFMSSFDCSGVFEKLMKANSKKFEVFIKEYLYELKTGSKIDTIFDKKLLDAIQA